MSLILEGSLRGHGSVYEENDEGVSYPTDKKSEDIGKRQKDGIGRHKHDTVFKIIHKFGKKHAEPSGGVIEPNPVDIQRYATSDNINAVNETRPVNMAVNIYILCDQERG